MTVEMSGNDLHIDAIKAARHLESAVRDSVGASALVSMVPFESLTRTEGKTVWIERTTL
jgi:hypothetical protein